MVFESFSKKMQELIKEKGFMGLMAIKSSASKAPRDLEKPGDLDFYEYASIRPDKLLPRPESVILLRVGSFWI